MFDMGWDKLLLVGLLVGLVAGPERLLAWSRTAVQMLGRLRGAYREGKAQVVGELDQFAPDWRSYDPRQMDPRRIIRSALEGDDPVPVTVSAVEAPAPRDVARGTGVAPVRLDPLEPRRHRAMVRTLDDVDGIELPRRPEGDASTTSG